MKIADTASCRRIRLMTHNLWDCDENTPAWAERGADCSAAVRSQGILRVYRETCPDIIGCQEVSPLIDHIYVIGEKDGSVKRFERYSPEYYYPISDHSPAYVDLEL